MKRLLQIGPDGRMSALPEKRFLTNPGRVSCLIWIIMALAAIWLPVIGAKAATVTWLPSGPSTNDWTIGTNWSGGNAPTNGDDVVITNLNVGVLLTNATYSLSSIVLSNRCTLIFSNWDTSLSATNVTVLSNAVLTCAGPFLSTNVPVDMSNRVWVVASSNVTIDFGGKINVDAKGYSGGISSNGWFAQGPGAAGGGASSTGCGGGHGGRGGDGVGGGQNVAGNRYDSTNAPTVPGSGGGGYSSTAGGHGGGAVLIEATNGVVTVNGTITANGQSATYGGGSGGSVYIRCLRLAGSAPGAITAKGGTTANRSGMGGGGRVSVVYDLSAQASGARPGVQFDVSPGSGLWTSSQGILGAVGELGSLYLPDTQLLTNNVTAMSGRLFGIGNWSPERLTVDNSWLEFGDSIRLYVTNDISVINNGRLGGNLIECGGNMTVATGTVYLYSGYWRRTVSSLYRVYRDYGTNPPPVLTVGGDLTLVGTNTLNCAIYIYGVATNMAGYTNYGALVTVTGQFHVGSNTAIYPNSELMATNGGSPLMQVGSLLVDDGGFIDASGLGFRGGNAAAGTRDGTGPGRGKNASPAGGGGGYGGIGGIFSNGVSGMTYGSSNAPVDAGSGGGMGYTAGNAGNGGGLIRVEAAGGSITVWGTLQAVGDDCANNSSGGGSGGGIYLRCKTFSGNGGSLIADGGNATGSAYGGGGGGRIAVWYAIGSTNGVYASAAGGTSDAGGISNGAPGTIVWGLLPVPGTIFSSH